MDMVIMIMEGKMVVITPKTMIAQALLTWISYKKSYLLYGAY